MEHWLDFNALTWDIRLLVLVWRFHPWRQQNSKFPPPPPPTQVNQITLKIQTLWKNNRHGWASPVSIETAASQLRPHWVINSGTEVMEGCLREPETDEVCVEPSRRWQIFAGSAVQHRSRNQTRARETEIRLQEELVVFVDINDCSAAQKSAAR